MIGKTNRLARILGKNRRTVIVPIDQSITSGPIPGLDNLRNTLQSITEGGPNAVLMQRGPVMAGLWNPGAESSLIVHLSGGTQLSEEAQVKICVCSVEDAIRLGADAVSVHVSLGLGNERDGQALAELGRISGECQRWGMPILAMMYVYGAHHQNNPASIIHAARVGAELGVDLIKVNYTGDINSFRQLIDTCYVPIVVAGGDTDGDGYGILKQAEIVLSEGAAGVCIGRNVYQHKNPAQMVRALSSIAHRGCTADEVYDEFILPKNTLAQEHDVDEDIEDIYELSHSLTRSH
jgi:predicted phospho-2-dehydro-3-deoxyheptonate aldolase